MNAADGHGFTPLHRAAVYGHVETPKVLLARGAKPDARDKEGQTPLDLAKSRGYAELAALLERGGE